MRKNMFILPVISLVLMSGVLIYFFIDLKRFDNKYQVENKRTQVATEEAEVVIILGDIKKELNAPFTIIRRDTFGWSTQDQLEIVGWSITVNRVDVTLLDRVGEYLKNKGFKHDTLNTGTNNGYIMKNTVCLEEHRLLEGNKSSVKVYCGYIK